MKNPCWNRLFFGGANKTLLFFGFPVSNPTVLTDNPTGLVAFSSPTRLIGTDCGTGDSARVNGGETRLGAVPIAFEIESNGRIGRETGNDGIRRGKVDEVGEGEGEPEHEVGDTAPFPTPPGRYTEFEE